MSALSFSFPTPILFGPGSVRELPRLLRSLGIKRPLVVTDPGLLTTDAFRLLTEALMPGRQDQHWFIFSEVHPNPHEEDVHKAADTFLRTQSDGVIAFGGGSALDVGKACRLRVKQAAIVLEDFPGDKDWSGLAPCIAIPTTAGTGSEVGRSAVITLEKTRRKTILFHASLLPQQVILDPELTLGLPAKLTAATGADALTHCIESFTCPSFHPLCDGIALEGIHLIRHALPRAVRDGDDIEARGNMLIAASMGAIAFQKDLGVVHALAHPLSTICGVHHGLANALMLVAGMTFNAERKPGIYRRVGIACGLDTFRVTPAEADDVTIGFIERFLAEIGINTRLSDHGVTEGHLDALVTQAFDDPCHRTNVVSVSKEDLLTLYKARL
ncbi:MAG TPA: iron-containing alcohol dehydrogenase [Opitutaceae bacterium]|nr:iron-containing alcohol dehydrogenase [Opitutaceae bacterium]